MIMSARSRDPRLARIRPTPSNSVNQEPTTHRVPHAIVSLGGSSLTKSLPRIPKYSQSNNQNKRDHDEREHHVQRPQRNRHESSHSTKTKNSPSTRDRASKSSSSKSSRTNDHKKSGSSDDSSPRKKSEDEKRSSKGSHRSRSRSSKSPSKSSSSEALVKDVDLRVIPTDNTMKPDSTTSIRSNKDKLLSDLLNGEGIKSSHETITTNDNGNKNKPIIVVTINVCFFIVTSL